MTPLVIYGTGGLARQIHEIVLDINEVKQASFNLLGFLDDNVLIHGTHIHDLPVLGGMEWLSRRYDVQVVVGIGTSISRKKVVQRIEQQQPRTQFATLIHPTATVGRWAQIGAGTVIFPNVSNTTDYTIGRHCLLNLMSAVAHDDVVGDFVTLSPGAILSGNVAIGEGVELGTHSCVNPGLTVGEWSIVGAGAVVTRNLPAYITAVGVPAQIIKQRQPT